MMRSFWRMVAIGVIFLMVSVCWLVLGGVNENRSSQQSHDLRGRVSDLWGSVQEQQAPTFDFVWESTDEKTRSETVGGVERVITEYVTRNQEKAMEPSSTSIRADLSLDQRLKGLVWYSLYDVDFQGTWNYEHRSSRAGMLKIGFAFPDAQGLYDGFRFVVDGVDRAGELRPRNGRVVWTMPVEPEQKVALSVGYQSRGMDEWSYNPASGVGSLEHFDFSMNTDFKDIDYPNYAMSPSSREETDKGWALKWAFERVVTGHKIGMSMPDRIQPGELASSMSFTAPISLGFFFLVLFVLGTIRKIEIHPINYMFLGGAFFAFHLLFSYLVDHMGVVEAFATASAVSVLLVVSYLRLVVSARFALVEAGLAQVVYLIGFSLAHFWDGFTGLTVTVLSILTLFLLMQWTGRVRWSEALRGERA